MRHTGTALLIALLAAGVLSGSASAVTNPIIDWPPAEAFAWEPGFIMPHQSVGGNQLTIVGKIDLFQSPLDGNNPATDEYTFVFDQLVSQGSVFFEQGNFDQWKTNYSGGRFRIFKDTTPDRDYGINPPNGTAPSTFEDGDLILQGTMSRFRTVSNAYLINNNGGTYDADLVFTGGTQYGLLEPLCYDVLGAQGYLKGVWQRGYTGTPTGYIRSCDGKFDQYICPPVPVESSTWGRVKALYP